MAQQVEEISTERPPVSKPSGSGGALRGLLALVVVGALGVAGYYYWTFRSTFETTDDAQVDGNIYPVSARVGGRVTSVEVDNNQLTSAGQTLVRLDPTDYQVALQRAQADVQQAQADALAAQSQVPIITNNTSSQISTAGASVEEATVAISVAEQQHTAALARVREAEANAVKAQKDVERYRPLAEKQEISQQQFDQAVANAGALAASVDTARANADAALRQVAQARARLSQAQAQQSATKSSPQQIAAEQARAASMRAAIGVQQATLEQARLNIQYTVITSPVAGVVGQKAVQVGQQIQAGQQLMSVIPLDDLWVSANFKETQLRTMRVGQKATVHVDLTGRDYRGHVDSFPGATGSRYSLLPPENATGNYVKVVQRLPVKIVLEKGEDSDHLLRPGMSCEPKVYLK
jgi:membrane fusion protein (multidrug efflux system)